MKNGILIILDGYGEGKVGPFNAVKNAKTPTLNQLKTTPYSLLEASGEAVGVMKGELGGSEVGHLTIGAGRIIPSTVKKITDDINNNKFKNNKILTKNLTELKARKGNLHLIGMMSDKNIHSNILHAFQIIDMAKNKAKNIFLHLFTDGRDTPPQDGIKYLRKVKQKIKDIENCEIASLGGRGYGMDREGNLDRTTLAFNAMFSCTDEIENKDMEKYIKLQYQQGQNDQFITPVHVKTQAKFSLSNKDIALFFNFREDRLRQIVKMTEEKTPLKLITMASVDTSDTIQLYPVEQTHDTLSEYLSSLNLSQIKISESTKYAHVTYFLNGGREEPFEREDRIHVPSYKVKNFATKPKMRAKAIAAEAVKAIKHNYNAIFVNFSNPDMLGHTGDYYATVKSLEFMDKCLKKVLDAAEEHGYVALITADHGNADEMRTKDGEPHMAHTLSKVFCAVKTSGEYYMKKLGGLKDIAPTFCDLMGIKPAKSFEGESLIIRP